MSIIVKAGQGHQVEALGGIMRLKLEGADTDGQYTLIEDTLQPGFQAGLHLHREHRESFYVLEGELTFTLGNQVIVARPGTTIHVPANTPHDARSGAGGKMLTIFSPAGIEGAMRAFAALKPEEQTPASYQAIMAEFDRVDLTAPSIPVLLRFYDLLLAGEAKTLLTLFTAEPQIDTPLEGAIMGRSAFEGYVSGQQAWLSARQARSQLVNILITPERFILEFVLDLVQDSEAFDLPIAMAADRAGERVAAIRIYHSTWPLTGGHIVRAPLLSPPVEELPEPAVIKAYMAGIREPDKRLVLSLFAPEAYVREPAGSRYTHVGPDGLRHFYDPALDAGGIVLHHCTAIFDGHSFGVEFICDEWAHVKLPPQAGLAVYQVTKDGKIQAARIYDDVSPPFLE